MGRIARKILQGFEKARSMAVVDFEAHLAAKKRSDEYQGQLHIVERLLRRGFDPLHAHYIAAQNLLSLLCEELTLLPVMKPFVRIVSEAENLYMPDGPPFSALTRSYFVCWAFFDVLFGKDKESIGSCVQELSTDLAIDSSLLTTIQLMQHSRMGIYEHCGTAESEIILRDLTDDRTCYCYVPTGYQGKTGQLWYVRLMPPLPGYHYHIAFTTPYILMNTREEWLAYLHRMVPQTKGPELPCPVTGIIQYFLKHGLHATYWLDYIVSGYVGAQDNAIFLAGIPDQMEALATELEENPF
ncbi:hypothetical protein [Candidatus Magnetaquicoccus inordinatus]|uniref:hypothetical protein n=1 Tax=Candidatus Magnetaquicoccus inordinatus TaxID=2496818 RepID=UPI00102BFE51|nr:hypothetical protein [Candidatus Magnetaquicoccus inordinatus]